jgi:hypothetical protein
MMIPHQATRVSGHVFDIRKRRNWSMSEEKEKPLEKMTIKDLKEIALQIPHDTHEIAVQDMNKEQLVAFIKKSRGIKDEPHETHKNKKKKKAAKEKVVLTRQEIKQLIRKLKEEKAALGGHAENKDKKRISILRRRISRLKKLSRKAA